MEVAIDFDHDDSRPHDAAEGNMPLRRRRELEIGAGVMLAVTSALQVGDAGVGLSGHGGMAVAAEDQVDGAACAQLSGRLVRGAMDEEDGGVALAAGLQRSGDFVGDRIVLPDGIPFPGELRSQTRIISILILDMDAMQLLKLHLTS